LPISENPVPFSLRVEFSSGFHHPISEHYFCLTSYLLHNRLTFKTLRGNFKMSLSTNWRTINVDALDPESSVNFDLSSLAPSVPPTSSAECQAIVQQIRQLLRGGDSEGALRGALDTTPYGADERGKVRTPSKNHLYCSGWRRFPDFMGSRDDVSDERPTARKIGMWNWGALKRKSNG
jgi:ARP2/3 complex subunit p16-Arc